MELYKGRPADVTGRLEKEIRVYDFLDKMGVEYLRIDHEPAFNMEICEEIDKTLQAVICKNCPNKLVRQDCLLQSRSIWKNFWILHRGQPALWD